MKIVKRSSDMAEFLKRARKSKKSVGLVPTMGCLHEGHLALICAAKKECGTVIVSIFVNPLQFSPSEDLKKYPRDIKKDIKLLQGAGVDVLFLPKPKEIYLPGFSTFVSSPLLGTKLCGKSRPIHFRGVLTVVLKLFNIISPDRAYFGEKDFQQLVIIKKMVSDLNIPVKVVAVPTVREADGLAMSSRNVYLSEEQRTSARVIYKALSLAKRSALKGERSSKKLISMMKKEIFRARPKVKIDYLEVVDPATLEKKEKVVGATLIAVAAYVGATRLIDNILIKG